MSKYKGLIHVLFDSQGCDVRKSKIYFRYGKYTVHLKCEKCKAHVGCLCYDTLEEAIEEKENMRNFCDRHYIEEEWFDLIELIAEEAPHLGLMELWEKVDNVETEEEDTQVRNEICERIKKLTDEECIKVLRNVDHDDCLTGMVCDV